MTVTLVTRYTVGDLKVAMAESKRAKAMWLKAGAKEFRVSQFFTGAFNGQWLFHTVFDDFAHFQSCRDAVIKTKDYATIQANNVKADNKQVGRELLVGLDV
jgi:hypothetical protein